MLKGWQIFSLKADFADNIFPVHRCQYLLVFLDISCLLFPKYSGIIIYFEVDWITSAASSVCVKKFSDCMFTALLKLCDDHVMIGHGLVDLLQSCFCFTFIPNLLCCHIKTVIWMEVCIRRFLKNVIKRTARVCEIQNGENFQRNNLWKVAFCNGMLSWSW